MHSDVAIPVTGASSIVGFAHGHSGHHGYSNRDNLAELLLAGQISAGFVNTQNTVHTASVNGIKETADAARDTIHAVRDSIDATNQIGNINLQSTERNGGETRATTERSSGVIRDAISFAANQAARDHSRVMEEICDVRKEMSDGFGQTVLEMTKQHCDIKLEVTKQHAELGRQVDARAAEAARQLAECCCKLEAKMAEAENNRVRDDLQQARAELLAMRNGPGKS